jgi:hypothetical protein
MIITVEDDRELGLHVLPKRDANGHLVAGPGGRPEPLRPSALVRAYEARPANSEGVGEVGMGDLLRHSLRDSGDVIVVGETRGADIVHHYRSSTRYAPRPHSTSSCMCSATESMNASSLR